MNKKSIGYVRINRYFKAITLILEEKIITSDEFQLSQSHFLSLKLYFLLLAIAYINEMHTVIVIFFIHVQ